MTKKTPTTAKLIRLVELEWPRPRPAEEATLLEQGMLAVLQRHLSYEESLGALDALRAGYDDWNELRVTQAQDIASDLGYEPGDGERIAQDVRTYLQEVFQQTHGLDLEFLREDPLQSSRFVVQLRFLGLATSYYLLSLASGEMPVTTAMVRVLDRFGLMARTSSMRKARVAIEPLVPAEGQLEFAMVLGQVASRWCDSRKPLCWECPLHEKCTVGKRVYRDWQAQQARLAAQRVREQERTRKRRETEDRKRQRDLERREREAERRRRGEERRREATKRKLIQERARRETAKKKAAAARKKASKKASKKAATRKKPVRKAARKAASKAVSKAVRKGARKSTAKASRSGRKVARKAASKKAARGGSARRR